MDNKFHVHLVSDSTGETLHAMANAALAQFENVDVHIHAYALVRSEHQLSRALDQLDADGLIRREADPQDSRATRVYITEAGRGVFETLWPHMAEAQARMFRGIPEDERRAFVSTLQKMLANIRKHEI